MTPDSLLSEAVELAVEKNPSLIVEPYYQLKAAARILAQAVLADGADQNAVLRIKEAANRLNSQ